MNVRDEIKIKIKEYAIKNNIAPVRKTGVPKIYQKYMLNGRFDDNMIDNVIYDLAGEDEALVALIGKKLYESQEFQIYYNTIRTIKDKSTK